VSTTDLAPTFLEVAGLRIPGEMTGRSLVSMLVSGKSGRVEKERDHVLFGKERHLPAQEAPDMGGYPMRALRTDDYLYIRNFRADRWPAGTPNYQSAVIENAWLGDCDNSPTKWYLWIHRDDPKVKKYYDLAFGKRPVEELYDLKKDPGQINNLAGDAAYDRIRKQLGVELFIKLKAMEDPRAAGRGRFFDVQPYLGGAPKYPEL
jgi:arylsulfatase A-like enzyme